MAGELAAEWIRVPDGNGGLKKVWVRDSTARRDIAQLQTDVSGLVIPDPSDASPQMNGTAAAGSSADYSRADHVHPSDTSKADAATTLAGYGITDAYTKAQVDGMIPSVPSAYTSNPEMDGTASPGTSAAWARGDHVHPHDSTKADVSAIPTKISDLTNDSGFIDVTAIQTYLAQKFAVVSGTFASSGNYSAEVPFPTGFNENNCVLVGFEAEYNGYMRSGDGIYANNGRTLIDISSAGIRSYNSVAAGYSKSWKATLMRTDI